MDRGLAEGFVVCDHNHANMLEFRHFQVCFKNYGEAKQIADMVKGEVATIPLDLLTCNQCGHKGDNFDFVASESRCNTCSNAQAQAVILARY